MPKLSSTESKFLSLSSPYQRKPNYDFSNEDAVKLESISSTFSDVPVMPQSAVDNNNNNSNGDGSLSSHRSVESNRNVNDDLHSVLSLNQTINNLVKSSLSQSTAASVIFTAVTRCWLMFRSLEDVCSFWCSYTGSTQISNRVYHRSFLHFESTNLIQLFSYYALFDEIQLSLCELVMMANGNTLYPDAAAAAEKKVVDALMVLDRVRLETSLLCKV